MGWVTGIVVFFLVWWTMLFVVLPIGIRPDPEAAEAGGWRGAPRQVRAVRVAVLTTILSVAVWLVIEWLTVADWLSFRDGWLSMPND